MPKRSKALFGRNVMPIVLLIFGFFITFNLWTGMRESVLNELTTEFNFRTVEAIIRIDESMHTHKQGLRSAVGLFTVSGNVTREQFNTFITQLQIEQNYPGIQGIGFIDIVPGDQKEKHTDAMRAQGFPGYEIRPEGSRAVYTPVVYIEPFLGLNREAVGYDMYADPRFRETMDQARDSGEAALTPKLAVKQEAGSEPQFGFFTFLPVYRTRLPPETPQARRENIIGWVYAPFQMEKLMHALAGERAGNLDIEIYDGDQISDADKIYDTEPGTDTSNSAPKLRRVDRIAMGNRHWLVATSTTPAFGQYIDDDRPSMVLNSGIGFSLLLALLVWSFLDDRERAIQAAEQAMRLALFDALTGLPNRKLINERSAQALARARRDGGQVALLFIDLDKFKSVNDEYGHAVGDLLLKEVAMRLQHCVRASDTVARLGGDEFVALLVDIEGKQGASVVAEKMLHALTQPFDVAGHSLQIAGSIGIAIFPDNAADQNALFKCADKAMYEAKNSGRSTIRFA